ncbi:prolyl oligopeptidase family serine peptidase [Streptomyces sp. NPDC001594]|uniref:prolyl oligopeptidase family serine peptidase n=1 Tax=Streptomyces sp. NPDC001594 TaxID=3364590 RepID=UPI0036A72F3C
MTRMTASPGADHAWFVHTDFLHAPAVHRFDLAERGTEPLAPAEGDGRRTGTGPAVRQVTYASGDGTEVPMYLILPPGAEQGPRPTILHAYGGFGASAAPGYGTSLMAWVRAGGIYAIAGVRGGGEKGAAWHAAGSGANKPNAFTDFSAAARWLTGQGWTTPSQLAIRGASHSGLTVAAALTRDPSQYAAAVCSDALTDMARYPRFGIGTWWLREFGDPDNPEDIDTLLGYSPYHNVVPGTFYPAVLVTSPRHDARVGDEHTRKKSGSLPLQGEGPLSLRRTGAGRQPAYPKEISTPGNCSLRWRSSSSRPAPGGAWPTSHPGYTPRVPSKWSGRRRTKPPRRGSWRSPTRTTEPAAT